MKNKLNQNLPEGVTYYAGKKPGKAVAIFAGVHGNEKAGIYAMKKLEKELPSLIESGSVYLVRANPKAIEQDIRFTQKNLNRCFFTNRSGENYEELRAAELIPILDQVDALLDVHASNTPGSTPFLIGEELTKEFAAYVDFPISSTGWDNLEPGATDGYMFNAGKFGLCAECGWSGESEKYADLAYDTMKKFLIYFGIIKGELGDKKSDQKLLHVDTVITKPSPEPGFTKQYKDFEDVAKNEVYAVWGDVEYKAKKDSVIIFANPYKEVGAEACIFGQWVNQ